MSPATNAVSERSVSSMRRIKNWLRSTMPQERLNHWWKSKTRVTSYVLRVQIHELRIQIHELRVQIHKLRVQIHELRVQIHELEE